MRRIHKIHIPVFWLSLRVSAAWESLSAGQVTKLELSICVCARMCMCVRMVVLCWFWSFHTSLLFASFVLYFCDVVYRRVHSVNSVNDSP